VHSRSGRGDTENESDEEQDDFLHGPDPTKWTLLPISISFESSRAS
jgi:hypothetical protein